MKQQKYFIHILIATFLCSSYTLSAQQVIATSGNYHQNVSGSIEYTIGEPVIETLSNTSNIITQGFHQTKLIISEISKIENLKLDVLVYPNPTNDFVIIKSSIINNMSFVILDINGKDLQRGNVINNETKIIFGTLPAATYFLNISENSEQIKSFKIIKQ